MEQGVKVRECVKQSDIRAIFASLYTCRDLSNTQKLRVMTTHKMIAGMKMTRNIKQMALTKVCAHRCRWCGLLEVSPVRWVANLRKMAGLEDVCVLCIRKYT